MKRCPTGSARLASWFGAAALLAWALPAPAGGGVQFHLDPVEFEAAVAGAGKLGKAFWPLTPNTLPNATVVSLDDPLDIGTHALNPGDPWTAPAGGSLWPPDVDNVQFSSNMTPLGPLTPAGDNGLSLVGPGFLGNANHVLVASSFFDGLSIISGPPAGDGHSAVGLDLFDFLGSFVTVAVFDPDGALLAQTGVPVPFGQTVFLGIVRDECLPIGRIDLFDFTGNEGISSIALYHSEPPAPGAVQFYAEPLVFDAAIEAHGKLSKVEWSLVPNSLLAGAIPLNDPLDIGTHALNPADPWTGPGGENLWPQELDNAGFSSNTNPGGTLVPRGDDGLALLAPGFLDNPFPALVAGTFSDAFDIIIGPPAGDPHTAIGLELVDVVGGSTVQVIVFDDNDVQLAQTGVLIPTGETVFLGIIRASGQPIGRVEIFNPSGNEGIASIALYHDEPPAPGSVQFYSEPVVFEAAVAARGMVSKGAWGLVPNDLATGAVSLDDPLDIDTHALDPDDPWTGPAGENLWPPELDNVRFSSNTIPGAPLAPRGNDGLALLAPGFAGNPTWALVPGVFSDAFDIVSGPPAGESHAALGLELVNVLGGSIVHVAVFDDEDVMLAKTGVLVPAGETAFLGILRETGAAIGRVEVFDLTGNEGISSISLYADAAAPCPWDTAGAGGPPDGAVGINDFLDLLAHWGPCPPCPGQCPWDTSGPGGSPDGAAGINDFLELLAHWGACPG